MVALVGAGKVPTNHFFAHPPTAKRPHSLSLATHLLSKLCFEECRPINSYLNWTETVCGWEGSEKMWEDCLKSIFPFLVITKVSNFFTKCLHQGSIRMFMEGVDNVHRTFSAAPLAPPCADNVLSFL